MGAQDKMRRETYQDYLVPGRTYRVSKAFLDARKTVHRPGETWVYLGYTGYGFAETTAIYTRGPNGVEGGFGIDWNDQTDNLLEHLRDYIESVEP